MSLRALLIRIMGMKQPRALSHDEKKAAEAAFHGKPFQPSWSQSARLVYEGVLKAKDISLDSVESLGKDSDSVETQIVGAELFGEALNQELSPMESIAIHEPVPHSITRQIILREEAIEAGLLIDVSQKAKGVGFNFAVSITKSLWSQSISESPEAPTSEDENRVRDMLLAVRLRLASLDTPSPWVEVPVLFSSQQGESTTKIFPIYALFHKDPATDACLTLIHPKELSSIRPSSHTNAEEEQSSSDLS